MDAGARLRRPLPARARGRWRRMTTSNAKLRAAVYWRVSTRQQDVAMQRNETRDLVKRRGWTLAMTFSDEGHSGASSTRPGLAELRAAARRRAFDVLVVYRTDRVFRSLRELLDVLDELGELGIGFVSVHEPFDTTTSAGRLLLQIVGAFAEFERNVLRERTKSGLAAARRRGRELGRPRRHVDLLAVRELRGHGYTFEQIAEQLGVGLSTLKRALA